MGHAEAKPEASLKAGTWPADFSRSKLMAFLFLVITPLPYTRPFPPVSLSPNSRSRLPLVCFLTPENTVNTLPSLK